MEGNCLNQDRRKYKRVKVNFVFIYQVTSPLSLRMGVGWDREINALMLDLSEDGMAFCTDYELPPTTAIYIRFTLINSGTDNHVKLIETIGEVRYNLPIQTDEYRVGVRFVNMHSDDRKIIGNFIKKTR